MQFFKFLGFFFLFFIISFQLFQKLGFRFHDSRSVTSTTWTVPFAFRLCRELNARKMEPLDGTQIIVTPNHFTKRNLKRKRGETLKLELNIIFTNNSYLIAKTVCWLVGIDRNFLGWSTSFLFSVVASSRTTLFLLWSSCSFQVFKIKNSKISLLIKWMFLTWCCCWISNIRCLPLRGPDVDRSRGNRWIPILNENKN